VNLKRKGTYRRGGQGRVPATVEGMRGTGTYVDGGIEGREENEMGSGGSPTSPTSPTPYFSSFYSAVYTSCTGALLR